MIFLDADYAENLNHELTLIRWNYGAREEKYNVPFCLLHLGSEDEVRE